MSKTYPFYIMMGPPGSGKGTQSQYLAQSTRLPHISSGDLLREAINQGSPFGTQAKAYLDKGLLVSDEVVFGLVKERLEICGSGCILDGIPRNLNQASLLQPFLDEYYPNYQVILLEASEQTIVQRICSRYICPQCKLVFNQSQQITDCPSCHVPLTRRSDDNPETVLERLRIYKESTSPLIEYYEKLGKLHRISAELPSQEVSQQILQLIQ